MPNQGDFASDQCSRKPQFELGASRREAMQRSAHVSAGYRRWCSFDDGEQPGQDFCAFRFDDRYTVGVVTDGVSQSYFGNIAARAVGEALLAVLWQRREDPPAHRDLPGLLSPQQPMIAEKLADLPPARRTAQSAPTLLDRALDEARSEGSQAVLGGVVLDRVNRVADVYLLGDITAVVHGPARPRDPIQGHERARWSSSAGVKGELFHQRIPDVDCVVIKSDGMPSWWGLDANDGVEQSYFERHAQNWAEKDDVSFVWLASREVAIPDPAAARRRRRQTATGKATQRDREGHDAVTANHRDEDRDEHGPRRLMTAGRATAAYDRHRQSFALGVVTGIVAVGSLVAAWRLGSRILLPPPPVCGISSDRPELAPGSGAALAGPTGNQAATSPPRPEHEAGTPDSDGSPTTDAAGAEPDGAHADGKRGTGREAHDSEHDGPQRPARVPAWLSMSRFEYDGTRQLRAPTSPPGDDDPAQGPSTPGQGSSPRPGDRTDSTQPSMKTPGDR